MTLTITADASDMEGVRSLLSSLCFPMPVASGDSMASSRRDDAAEEEPTSDRSRWSYEEFVRFWDAIKPGAKRALIQMAEQPDGMSVPELERSLGTSPRVFGPQLSSVGHQLIAFPDKPRPYRRDSSTKERYVMPRYIAEYIRRLAPGAAKST